MFEHPAILPDGPWMLRTACTKCGYSEGGRPSSYDVTLLTGSKVIEHSGGVQVTATIACPKQHQSIFVTSPAQFIRFTKAFPERRQVA